ncbi:leucyl/phenylalanyl-tRNA--protein transferase [Microlunatus panaciterrae]|uniref:Leucyl/phenylalanyl-tRNA--protein transferase n=1 Tax=Microlunatus panaciterrae TaxID=400768 RepID=A0ABS2RJ81_9ACTN|nr:leucyl/phenylalanyl-tRNA--protein transferase [Microlunatus panaciterrae]MBM7799055.1 leucyl/phenylalanyl-tRNA--protein transferase [Microlunatus panaciterrae]
MEEPSEVSSPFGPPAHWRRDDLIAVSTEFDRAMVLAAYRSGVFPMPAHRGLMGWYSPLRRGVLPLDGLRVTRSLRKMTARYQVRVDTAFDEVLRRCANPRRDGGWINQDIKRVYGELHRAGVVHSVESWTMDGRLAGGLYGVSLGGLFAGESMFHDPEIGRDASKVALVGLVDLLRGAGPAGRLLDVQWQTPHLESLGVVEMDREEYLQRLHRALQLPPPDWHPSEQS